MVRNFDTFGNEDLSTPEIKLVQNLGSADAKQNGAVPGDFYFPLTGEIFKAQTGFRFVLADVTKVRTYWGRSDISTDPPECSSTNASSGQSDTGIDCLTCPHRNDTPWTLSKEERRNVCQTSFVLLCVMANKEKTPFILRASGTSCRAAKELFTALKINVDINGVYERALIHATSAHVKTPSGEAYVLKFAIDSILSDSQMDNIGPVVASLIGETYQPLALAAPDVSDDLEHIFDEEQAKPVDAPTKRVKDFAASEVPTKQVAKPVATNTPQNAPAENKKAATEEDLFPF
jgi:hypothetical protein